MLKFESEFMTRNQQ